MDTLFPKKSWALILGGSSGFGLATAKRLAEAGMNLCIVHRDRRAQMPQVEAEFRSLEKLGVRCSFHNSNALDPDQRERLLDDLENLFSAEDRVHLLLHSIALGHLKPMLSKEEGGKSLSEQDVERTIHNMGSSLLGWVQSLVQRKLFSETARVVGLTSEGNQLAWPGYAAISAAKATLEALVRSMAVEMAPFGLRCNVLQPGVTITPALRLIPGNEVMQEHARMRNPYGRLTQPRDVANVIYLLTQPEADWINGALIRVDGGEHISGHLG